MAEKILTIDDVLAMLEELGPDRGRRGSRALVAMLEQDLQVAALYHEIRMMAIDAGTDCTRPGWEREAVEAHRMLDRLLSLDADARALELEAGDAMTADDYGCLLQICAGRQARGKGEKARLAALEIELTASLQDYKTPGIREAQESLDLAIEQLVSAYAENVGSKLAPIKASRHLIARGCRELRALEKPARHLAAG